MELRGSKKRRQEILELARSTGLANVEEISDRFSVTPSTVRRDLAYLTDKGLLVRTYGGAMAPPGEGEASLARRLGDAAEAKRAIARWAATQIRPGETVLLDSGSTVGALAHALRDARNVTVITPSLMAIEELSEAPGITLHCLGGTLRPLSKGFVGPIAEAALERMSFDHAFLGTDGVTADRGICEADMQQTRLKELMARRARTTYVLAHAAKIGQGPFHCWVRLPEPWVLVTDAGVSSAQLEPFKRAGVKVVVVDLP